ncbi:ribonuclease H-like domain-containing protein [Ammoniphilus sp. CFH 90114]|uniref:ribonuclease H-like domain-containing protein n=1 Tax=Ammoniphilus sp. CFH 90114 TaxID=2493665 RepID=UPI00100E41BB|nr:ribonuclease H-like domain-containing protein [Ammoniphilus sp. CFH 90114]RXT04196.1 hypothetical protein EIZ39_21730 [Ammoniphilus sp. CFH 90114]
MSLKNKLQRMKSHLTQEARRQPVPAPPPSPVLDIPFQSAWGELQAKPFFYEDEYVMVREISYPLKHQHGRYTFEQLLELVERWNQTTGNHPLSAGGTQASELLFFDTETTGLHGGAGNAIFLLGYARVLREEVRVKQFFLPDPNEEVAFYQGFLDDVKELKNLVTYNGKAFDWPQVKTRHTLLRDLVPRLPLFGHYDLLHGARRLWKDELESCRLSVIEQEILQVKRHEDTPGYMAPLLYFDFLRDKNPETIKGVLHHNEWDVLSLITLYIHISSLLLDEGSLTCSTQEMYQIGRWYEQVGDFDRAFYFYQLAQEWLPAKIALASLYKRVKSWDMAIRLWEEIAGRESPFLAEVYTQLAKAYEHHEKDYEKALFYADKAYASWKLLKGKKMKEKADYVKRIERLERKCLMMG